MAEELAPYIYLPLPTLKDLPNPSAGRDEKLRTIIANIDKQHQMVRNNIITAATSRLKQHKSAIAQSTPPSPVPDTMEISSDTDTPAAAAAEEGEGGGDPAVAHAEAQRPSRATALLLHNLNAPHAGDGDPCVPPDGTLPPPPPDVPQATPPLEIRATGEAMRLVEAYDAIAWEAREYYVRALRRGSAAAATAGAGGGGRANASVTPALRGGYGGGGPGSAGPAHGRPNASPAKTPANASPVDVSRDPRRMGR